MKNFTSILLPVACCLLPFLIRIFQVRQKHIVDSGVILLSLFWQSFALSQPITMPTRECPNDLATLTELLLKDLPSYANRVIQRARKLERDVDIFSYVIIAGKAEFEPIAINHREYDPVFAETTKQIFFTTLERQYNQEKVYTFQNYHWLFLAETSSGWRLVMSFSRLGSPHTGQPPLPAKESTDSVIGQSVSLWLRDCHAGTIR